MAFANLNEHKTTSRQLAMLAVVAREKLAIYNDDALLEWIEYNSPEPHQFHRLEDMTLRYVGNLITYINGLG